VLISKFSTGLTDRLTDGQNQLLNPFAHARVGYKVFTHRQLQPTYRIQVRSESNDLRSIQQTQSNFASPVQ